MKISASLYSSVEKELDHLVKELDRHQIDAFHIDCNDDLEVFNDIQQIRQLSKTPIDLHIISSEPEKFFDLIEKYKIEYVQFQYENLIHKPLFPIFSASKLGLAITSDTPTDVFDQYYNDCSFILMMTTVPGQSGGTFRKENFQRIRKFRNKYPDKRIHVDGGVNDEVSFILRNMGVHLVVSGSYLVNNLSIGAAIINMKIQDVHSHYLIKDFMIDLEDCPVLNIDNADFTKTLVEIDKYDLGFTFYVDPDGKLSGLSSNADVRKGLLKNLEDLNKVRLDDIINYKPVVISQEATISEMMQLIKNKKFIISFLPVVDADQRLAGAITFFNLIRGES